MGFSWCSEDEVHCSDTPAIAGFVLGGCLAFGRSWVVSTCWLVSHRMEIKMNGEMFFSCKNAEFLWCTTPAYSHTTCWYLQPWEW